MKRSLTISFIFFVAILFTANSYAQPFRGMKRGKGMMRQSPARILFVLKAKQKELKITDSQLEKIQSLVFSFEEKMIQVRTNSSLQRLELRKLLQDKQNLDYEKISTALSKASKARQDIFIEKLKLRDEIQNILTPEQGDALKAMPKDLRRGRRFFQRGNRLQQFPRLRERTKK